MLKEKIKALAADQGFSCRKIAILCGIKRAQTISDWFAGKKGLSEKNLEKVYKLFKIE